MTKWMVTYSDANGDYSTVWVEAHSREEAKEKVYRYYWDAEKVIMVKQM